jgi:hypothetical protein
MKPLQNTNTYDGFVCRVIVLFVGLWFVGFYGVVILFMVLFGGGVAPSLNPS